MNKYTLMAVTCGLALCIAAPAKASILVGTSTNAESIGEINSLITTYNTAKSASLASVVGLLDKLVDKEDAENEGLVNWEENAFVTSDFKFYVLDGPTVDLQTTVFNSGTLNFDEITPGSTITNPLNGTGKPDNFTTLDSKVWGFDQLNGPTVAYYVAKSGNEWSLWLATSGFNVVYKDNTITDSRGNTTDSSLVYDPNGTGLSHITFYSTTAAIPEPASIVTFTGLALCFGAAGAWRRRRNKVS